MAKPPVLVYCLFTKEAVWRPAGFMLNTAVRSKATVVAGIIAARHEEPIARLLVVGCGSGREAADLARALGCEVQGIDIQANFDPEAAKVAVLRRGDAMALDYSAESFDFVYSYHALEHIADAQLALSEMHRVLKPGGGYCIGTPNRDRLVGYIGSSQVSLKKKILWNIADWKARWQGRFRNEFGAHAGFTEKELNGMLTAALGEKITNVSRRYYEALYPPGLVRAIAIARCSRFLFPSIYFIGKKEAIF